MEDEHRVKREKKQGAPKCPSANEDSILEVGPISPAALDDTRCIRSKTPRQVLPEFLTYKIMSKVKPLFQSRKVVID